MKKLFAIALALCMLMGAALAEGSIASYRLPSGAQIVPYFQSSTFDVPEGLEPMYQLMNHVSSGSNVYLIRMKNGRAMVSVGSTKMNKTLTADELLALWPEASKGIQAVYAGAQEDTAAVENLYGRDLLHIRTEIGVGDETQLLMLQAEGFAFFRDESLIEVWAVCPADPVYLFDGEAAAQLESDRADMVQFLNSLDFSLEKDGVGVEPYNDPEGRFRLGVLPGSVVITPDADEDAVADARAKYAEAHPEGAGRAFDLYMQDVREQNVTLILTPDMQGAIEIFCSQEEDFAGVTPEMLCYLAQPILENLQKEYDSAELQGLNYSELELDGRPHAMIVYKLQAGDFTATMDLYGHVTEENWLCEVDVYTPEGNDELRGLLFSLLAETLTYLVD